MLTELESPSVDSILPVEAASQNQNLYLPPELLTPNEANEKARPGESPERRERRVKEMMESIRTGRQEYPVLVTAMDTDGDLSYEYIDGGCRVEAILRLNLESEPLGTRKVWCSLVDAGEDLFRTAVRSNIHRTQNSILEMGEICREARERNGWKGRGAAARVAEYLGLLPSRVTEYEKVMRAPDALKDRIRSGEIQSLDAALKLMSVPEARREEVVERAQEIAREEAAPLSVPEPEEEREPVTPVKARHVQRAAQELETGPASTQKRTRGQIIEFFASLLGGGAYPERASKWGMYFEKWCAGEGTDRQHTRLFDEMLGMRGPKEKPAAAPKKGKAAGKEASGGRGKQGK